jgi:hypothetical protein
MVEVVVRGHVLAVAGRRGVERTSAVEGQQPALDTRSVDQRAELVGTRAANWCRLR